LKNKFFKFSGNINYLFLYKIILLIWAQYIILDKFTVLSNLHISLFHNRGIFRLISIDNFFDTNISFIFLMFLKISILAILVLNFLQNNKFSLLIFIILIYIYELIKKGFGGHLDHRILTLYIFTLVLYISLENDFTNLDVALKFSYLFFFLQYFFIGLARIFSGFPEVFLGDTFTDWIIQRSLRPSYFNLEIGLKALEYLPTSFFNFIFFISTIFEVSAIYCIFIKNKYSKLICILLIFFHLGIYLFMSVNFIENIFLLLLFIYILEKDGLNEKIYSFH
jgi:hypothetical protein